MLFDIPLSFLSEAANASIENQHLEDLPCPPR